jgi:hypothetical protein
MGTASGGTNRRVNAQPGAQREPDPHGRGPTQYAWPLGIAGNRDLIRCANPPGATNCFTMRRRLSWEAVGRMSMKHHFAYLPHPLALPALALSALFCDRFVVSPVSVKYQPWREFTNIRHVDTAFGTPATAAIV